MIITIQDFLTQEELIQIRNILANGAMLDGRVTAGWHAKLVKNNQQLSPDELQPITQIFHAAVKRNGLIQVAVYPKKIAGPMASRYQVGMAYGTHVDDALMAITGSDFVRTDVSVTAFLSDPHQYQGGELVIEAKGGQQVHKLPAGSAVFYPSTSLHRVNPVTHGIREVLVAWVQSAVRSSEQREILFDLDRARRSLFNKQGKTEEFDLLSKTHANLVRLWADG